MGGRNTNATPAQSPARYVQFFEHPILSTKQTQMKKLKLICYFACLSILVSFNSNAQITPNVPSKFPTDYGAFTFALGSKVLIELKAVDSSKFEYKVLSIETIEDMYSFKKREDLFSKNPKENTIEIFFMGAFYNEGKEDKDYKTLLMLRNNLKERVNYKADIKYYNAEQFKNTSIVGASPGTNTKEIWPQKIDYITLYNFVKAN